MAKEKVTLEFLGVKIQQVLDEVAGLRADVRGQQRGLDNLRSEMSGFRSEVMHRFDEQDEKFRSLTDRLDRHERRIQALEDAGVEGSA